MAKHFILISLLLILSSACTQQVTPDVSSSEAAQSTPTMSLSTLEAQATPRTLTLGELAATEAAIPHPIFTETATATSTTTAGASLCPGAPGPYAAIGKQATVVEEDGDKLILRSEPALSPGTVIGELERFTQLRIVDGPVCVRETGASHWYWQVEVIPGGETGWVAEGDTQHSFIVVSVGTQYFQKNTPTATSASPCLGPHLPFSPGLEVMVMADNSDKLKLRSEPRIAPDTVLRELDQSTPLTIVDGPICVSSTGSSYWFWKVKVRSGGKSGWVAEGDGQSYFLEGNLP